MSSSASLFCAPHDDRPPLCLLGTNFPRSTILLWPWPHRCAISYSLCEFLCLCAYLSRVESDYHVGWNPVHRSGVAFESVIMAVTSLWSIVSRRGSNLSCRYFALALFRCLNIFGPASFESRLIKGEPSCLLGFPLVFSNEQFK